jgi:hypothetical protein
MQAGCELSEIAGRALDVERLGRAQQRDQNRPRIER